MNRILLLPIALGFACSAPEYVDLTFPNPADGDGASDADPEARMGKSTVRVQIRRQDKMAISDAAPPPMDSGDCPSLEEGGTQLALTPTHFDLDINRMALLGDADTPEVELIAPPADGELATNIVLTDAGWDSAEIELPHGTYTGISLQFIQFSADVPLTVPGTIDTETSTRVKGWLNDRDAVSKRDMTVEYEGVDHWFDASDGSLASTETESRPADATQLWPDESFWDTDPVVIRSDDADPISDFAFETADGTGTLVIDADTDLTQLELVFDVDGAILAWESDSPDGSLTLGEDCNPSLRLPAVEAREVLEGPEDTGS